MAMSAMRNELSPLALPALIVAYGAGVVASGGEPPSINRILWFAVNVLYWWKTRNDRDDDDRWRRRLRNVGRVRQVGHRLVTDSA